MTAPTTTTTTMNSDTPRHSGRAPAPPRHRIGLWGAGAAGVAVASNLVVWLIGRAADVGFVVPGRGGGSPVEVGAPEVTLTTVLPFAAGTALFALGARSRRSRRAVLTAAVVVAVGSAAMPLSLDTDAWTRVLLATMHLITGAVFVAALARTPAQASTTWD